MGQGPAVVVADGMRFFRQWLRGVLRARGWRVAGETDDGDEVVRLVRRSAPAAVILDVHLPGQDGFAVLQRLRAEAPEVPVIVCSAAGRADDVLRVRRLGAADFLLKPVQEERLWAALERAAGAAAGEGEAGDG